MSPLEGGRTSIYTKYHELRRYSDCLQYTIGEIRNLYSELYGDEKIFPCSSDIYVYR